MPNGADSVRDVVAQTYRTESRRVFATLIRLLGDFDLAEEMMQEAFAAALVQWPHAGVPANPRAWLVSAGRFKAIDVMRRRARFDVALQGMAERIASDAAAGDTAADATDASDPYAHAACDGAQTRHDDAHAVPLPHVVDDDQLRLIFMCCHPAISPDAQVALTLREVCGLTTEEIAHAFLTRAPTIAQRIVRAKSKIRDARIPFELPSDAVLHARLHSVLDVVYLVFNEGYAATFGDALTRCDLSAEAIRLGRLVVALLPDADAIGLLALMLLHDARRDARMVRDDVVLLDEQDRTRWDAAQIGEGLGLVEQALRAGSRTSHTIQAAIAALHAEARTPEATDWPQIVALYDVLMEIAPSAVVELNRAAAIAMARGPAEGLRRVDDILARGDLADYHLAHAVRADLLRRAGHMADAQTSYQRALSLASNASEQRFLQRRLAELVTERNDDA